jgi:hypothetical protein
LVYSANMGKGQVSVFLVIGLIILLAYGILTLDAVSVQRPETFSLKRDSLTSLVDQCTAEQLNLAIKDHGISNATVPFIEEELRGIKDCVIYPFSANDIIASEPQAKVELYDEVIIVELAFPISIEDENTKLEFKGETYTFQRHKTISISPGARLRSGDSSFEIWLPEDIQSSPIRMSIRPIDGRLEGEHSSLLYGNIAYEALPKGMVFEKPVTITMFLDSDPEDDLVIGYYDEDAKVWYGLPTEVKGDRLIASTDHFTPFGALYGQPETRMVISVPEQGDLFSFDPQACEIPALPPELPSTAERHIEIPLGDACINIAESTLGIETKGFIDNFHSGSDIIVELIGAEVPWQTTEPKIENGNIIMDITAADSDGDGCIPGMIKVTFYGIASGEQSPEDQDTGSPGSQADPPIGYEAEPEEPTELLPSGSLIWPLSDPCSRLTCGYLDPSPLCRNIEGQNHRGLDWGGFGKTVYSIADGEVQYASGDLSGTIGEWYGYGKAVLIRHNLDGETMYSLYAHLSTIDVKEGDEVTAGQKVGLSGSTGYSSGPHLHFELRKEPGTYLSDVNPHSYLPKRTC